MSIEQMDKATITFYAECASMAGVSLESWIQSDLEYWDEED